MDGIGGFEDAVARAGLARSEWSASPRSCPSRPRRGRLIELVRPRSVSEALRMLLPLESERVFAFDQSGLRLTPPP